MKVGLAFVFSVLVSINVEAGRLRLAGTVVREPSFEVKLDSAGRFAGVRGDQDYFRYEVVSPSVNGRSPASVASSGQDQVLVRIQAP